jgi:methylthioribose-1-phosphate isomerase
MKIHEKHYHTIWINEKNPEEVIIIDQQLLPFKFETQILKTPKDACTAIREMNVRGAPLIGVTAAYGLYLAALHAPLDDLLPTIRNEAQKIMCARPTAINLKAAVKYCLKRITNQKTRDKIIQEALNAANDLKQLEIENSKNIGKFGLDLIEVISKKKQGETVNILTHCNAGWLACIDYGTATAPIYMAHEKGIKLHVWVDETRPRNQGAKLTAFELGQQGIKHTIIPDNTSGHLMQHGKIDIIFVGTDRTSRNGDVANKIGTFLLACGALVEKVPFFVACPSSSIDWDIYDGVYETPIEKRSEEEVTHIEGVADGRIERIKITPEGSPAANYGFDVTPGELITGLITERGICKPNEKDMLTLFPEKKKI